MAFGLSAGTIAAIGTTAVGAYSASQNASAANADSNTNAVLGLYGGMINQANLQYTRDILNPFVQAGHGALQQQGDLIRQHGDLAGFNGAGAQQGALGSVESSPFFQDQVRQGEMALLQNASATGGVRGGNTQAALAQFRPGMLSAAVNDRFMRLGNQFNLLSGITTAGQNSAAGAGTASMQAAQQQNQVIQNMQQQNNLATRAGMNANNQMANSVAGGLGMWAGLGGNNSSSGGSGNTSWVSGGGNYEQYAQPDYGMYF